MFFSESYQRTPRLCVAAFCEQLLLCECCDRVINCFLICLTTCIELGNDVGRSAAEQLIVKLNHIREVVGDSHIIGSVLEDQIEHFFGVLITEFLELEDLLIVLRSNVLLAVPCHSFESIKSSFEVSGTATI